MRRAAAPLGRRGRSHVRLDQHADLAVGVADDHGKYAEDGGAAFFARLRGALPGRQPGHRPLGRGALRPRSTAPSSTARRRPRPRASASSSRSTRAGRTRSRRRRAAPAQFAEFLQLLARRYPQVRVHRRQRAQSAPLLAPAVRRRTGHPSRRRPSSLCSRLVRRAQGRRPRDPRVGVGLSERGNDNPSAPSNVSTSPIRFLRDLGAAYRASGRTAPMMDELEFHPYLRRRATRSRRTPGRAPASRTSTVSSRRSGTRSPAPGSRRSRTGSGCGSARSAGRSASPPRAGCTRRRERGCRDRRSASGHRLRRSSSATRRATRRSRPSIFFGLVDEPDLDRFQAALSGRDGSAPPAYDSVRAAIAETGGRCTGTAGTWRHTTTGRGPAASFGGLGPTFWKQKAWSFSRHGGRGGDVPCRRPSGPAEPKRHAGRCGRCSGRTCRFRAEDDPRALDAARHVPPRSCTGGRALRLRVELATTMNPARTSVLVSRPFLVR